MTVTTPVLPRIKLKPLKWTPHLPPVEVSQATQAQLKAMQVTPSSSKVSPYVRTLAHDPESYEARTTLFNDIMYVEGGLSRADRELGALAASLTNGCKYCANVHARRHASLAGSTKVISALFFERPDALTPRDSAIVAFAKALSATPPSANTEHISDLKEAGMTNAEIVDLMHAIAIFGWANRLMHPLGSAEI